MQRILIPVDGSANSLDAVRHVVRQFLCDANLEVHLLHVGLPFSRHVARFAGRNARADYHRKVAEDALRDAQELLRKHCVPHRTHVELGDAARVIDEVAENQRVHQIVLGTARKNLLTRLVEDSVAARVIETARVPVQVVVGTPAPRWENVGIPALVSAILAALLLAAGD